ncbi:hypothetical protein [Formosa sp. PL04]|uniref:hypothetical protein n=1 Tax=Formosa sp. PL04 TaxID=3081755 RepID=UPI002980E88C|nr:hypothetical protein [Formosa sp. PL04]MDW5288986.1 hypothetical protein [Formosa sp. PL04]
MNTNLPENSNSNLPQKQQNTTDEVDLIVLFNYIGKGFSNFFKFIGSLFKSLFKGLIYALKPVIKYAKIIILVMVVFAIAGYFLEKNKPVVYSSTMLVKPYYESKFQLINNIGYYNSLLGNADYKVLSNIFQIDTITAKNIKSFEVKKGPETETDLILEYEEFLQSTDSATASNFTYEKYLEGRDMYSSKIFEIKVEALKNNIFQDLEAGLNTTFENKYSQTLMDKRNKLYVIEKDNINSSLVKIDSLQKVYISVLEAESKSQSRKGMTIGDGLSFEKDKSVTKEYELFNREVELRNQLVRLEAEKLNEDTLFDVISGFQSVGNKVSKIQQKYMLILPILAFLVLYLIFTVSKTIKFIKNYEG